MKMKNWESAIYLVLYPIGFFLIVMFFAQCQTKEKTFHNHKEIESKKQRGAHVFGIDSTVNFAILHD